MNSYQKIEQRFKGKKILIFGLGLQDRGVNVAKFFYRLGCQVKITDQKSAKDLAVSLEKLGSQKFSFTLGRHETKDIDNSDVIIRNPSVIWSHPLLKRARKRNIPIFMDTSLFAKYFPGTLIGVTGSRGKTTTTHMIYEILRKYFKKNVFLAGNANPASSCQLLEKADRDSLAIAELSSWELEGFKEEKLSPKVAVLTNISPDHLDHHQSYQEYISSKEAIFNFQKQSDILLLNRKDDYAKSMAKKAVSKVYWFSQNTIPISWKLNLLGSHNRENAGAAYLVGKIFQVPETTIKDVLEKFKSLPHRLERLGTLNGVIFINDAISTTPTATVKALEAMQTPTILIIGGNTKHLPLEELVTAVMSKAKAIAVLVGTGSEELIKKLKIYKHSKIISTNQDFQHTIVGAYLAAKPGDSLLLSPAFTSFSEFNNVNERGDSFKQIFNSLKSSCQNNYHHEKKT